MFHLNSFVNEIKDIGRQMAEKINEQKKKLREEGIKVNKTHLVITGGRANVSMEAIEEQELPYTKEDIEDMLYNIDDVIKELEKKNNVQIDEVPF